MGMIGSAWRKAGKGKSEDEDAASPADPYKVSFQERAMAALAAMNNDLGPAMSLMQRPRIAARQDAAMKSILDLAQGPYAAGPSPTVSRGVAGPMGVAPGAGGAPPPLDALAGFAPPQMQSGSQPWSYQAPQRTGPVPMDDPRWTAAALNASRAGVSLDDFWKLQQQRQPDIAIGPDGRPYNKKDPAALAMQFRNPTAVNGWIVDQNNKANEGQYFGALPTGVIPNGQGGVANATGLTTAMQEQEQAQATGRTMGSPFSVPNGDGSTTLTLGSDYFNPGTGLRPAGGPGAGAGAPGGLGGAGGGFGRSQTPADRAYSENEAKAVGDLIGGSPTLRNTAQTSLQTANQGLAFVLGIKPDAYTGVKGELARFLPLAPEAVKTFAGDVASYKSLTNRALAENAKALGANPSNRDVKIMEAIYPSVSSPQVMATMFFATQAATANKQQAYADFLAGYDGPKTRQAVQQAWLQSPLSKRSIFQDPVWKGIEFGGKPSVVFKEKNGRQFGIFRPYKPDGSVNPGAQVFEAY